MSVCGEKPTLLNYIQFMYGCINTYTLDLQHRSIKKSIKWILFLNTILWRTSNLEISRSFCHSELMNIFSSRHSTNENDLGRKHICVVDNFNRRLLLEADSSDELDMAIIGQDRYYEKCRHVRHRSVGYTRGYNYYAEASWQNSYLLFQV